MTTSQRKLITRALTSAAQSYWLHKGFSCFTEIGLSSWGRLRADFIALKLNGDVVICEVKSSRADYTTDKKWRQYLQHCHSMYFVLTEAVWASIKSRMEEDGVFDEGVGVMVLSTDTGYLKCVRPCKRRSVDGPKHRSIVTRLAWRNGESKRTERRARQFIDLEAMTISSGLHNLPKDDALKAKRKRRFSKSRAKAARRRATLML